MKSFANCLVLSILLSSCTSLKQYSSVQQTDYPIYSFTNIEVIDGGFDSFGFCKIVKITGIIEIIDTGWEVYGYTLDHKEFKVDEFEKDNYIKTKKEYWKEMLSKYEDQGNYDYIKGLIVDDDLVKIQKM